jgi:hypothetical protein
VRFAGLAAGRGLRNSQPAAEAVVVWWLFSTLLFLAQGTQSFGGAETEIGEAALNQLLSMLPV